MIRYEVRGYLKHAEENIFADGCQPGTGTMFEGSHFSAYAFTLAVLLDKLKAEVPFACDGDSIEIDACDEPGRIDIAGMETHDAQEPSKSELARWKVGECRLWYVVYSFHVQRVTRETVALTGLL